ncbi:SDR family NAD(P)-dependent oxidoreductase [Novosphingobium sp.]|uniref:SDR family oxidoreductase n=1 Tax=Novosphingobium sp. TaxID=1874826 RepID=UPI0025D3888C|nr:SDR family NAD(P)-dependent oxidoreductase [Novosphingobium sp.]MCC6926088.1 SDR family NAD(P)-dependent oxidoreductase [Novosphingobium sp.]
MQLSGKTVLVTGATDGIGAQLIQQLRDRGAVVIGSGRSPEKVAVTRALGFEMIEADLSTAAGVDALLAGLGDRPIDVLVNNAGAGTNYDFRSGELDLDGAERTYYLNLQAPTQLIARLMPRLKARGEAMVVNVTSGLAVAPSMAAVYCASKAGLRSYTQAIRAQLKGTGVKVIEALPPLVDTQMTAGRGQNKMSPQECARQIVAGMESGRETINVGMVKVLQLVHSISPALARSIMLRF